MLHFTSPRHFCGLTLAALILAFPAALRAQTGYTLIDLGAPNGNGSYGYSINASGQVAGAAFTADSSAYHGFTWSGTTVTDLGSLGGTISQGNAINASGQIAGTSYFAGNVLYHAVRWTGITIADLGTLGGNNSYAYGINDSGQVAGASYLADNRTTHAVLWTGLTPNDLGTLGGSSSAAKAVNASGQVAGDSQTSGNAAYHAVRWTGNTIEDLGTLGGTRSYGEDINASGQVAGVAFTAGDTQSHAVRWTGTTATDLGTLGGDYSQAHGINAFGDVVGQYGQTDGASYAFLYTSGRMIDLNTFLPAGSGWVLTAAYGLNDSGWITGYGTINRLTHAYILKPVASTGTSRIALEGISDLSQVRSSAPLGTFHISLRTPGTSTEIFGKDVTLTTTAGSAFGTFTLTGIPNGTYNIAIKGSKSLRVLIAGFTIDGTASLPDITLPAGDANGDNTVDIADFNLLVEAYGSMANDGTGLYNPQADLNADGSIDISDFGLLANEYGMVGDL